MNFDLPFDAPTAARHIRDFIAGYIRSSGCRDLVIGLSGGVDSSVTAVLCRQVLGRDRTKCIFLPEEATPEDDRSHVERLVKEFDLACEEREVTSLVRSVGRLCIPETDRYALANAKARIRMTLLYACANMVGGLVCGTSNKSELLTGYYTKYGDGGVDIMPIADLYKTQVWQLARYLEIPSAIVEKPPSAGLFEGQTDEEDMKLSYRELDRILYSMEQNIPDSEIAEIVRVEVDEVLRIRKLMAATRHKRETPAICKMNERFCPVPDQPPY